MFIHRFLLTSGFWVFLVLAIMPGCVPKTASVPTVTLPALVAPGVELPTGSSPILDATNIYPVELETPSVMITVYFTDTIRYATGGPPFEVAVSRKANADAYMPEAVLNEFFKGPSAEESALGYEAITDGFTGFSKLDITDGIARVYLEGVCFSNGATYTIAQPLMKNLLQFEQVRYVKIFDQNGQTWEPDGPSNSIPACLEP